MALCSFRLRRAVTVSSSLFNHYRPLSFVPSLSSPHSISSSITPNHHYIPSLDRNQAGHLDLPCPFQLTLFGLSTASMSTRARSYGKELEDEKIGPDTILFEGCDYNHWLIVIDFPKDPKPSPEEMVETYVQTCAKVVGSVEEAKKKIYACSTLTYNGFQVEMSEEMANKFHGLPGVVFVLPDSYIDPVNKEYGGNKYINGTIIPRPPPIQYARHKGGRYGDRNRDFNRTNQPRGQYQQGNPVYDNRGPVQGDVRNFGAQQNPPPQQNYAASGAGERGDYMPMNNAFGGRDNYQGDGRGSMLPNEASYNQGQQGNYYSQEQRAFTRGAQSNYAPPQESGFRGENRNYAPPQSYGQEVGGTYGQEPGRTSGYGHGYARHGENQGFPQVEQRSNMQEEQRKYPAMGPSGTDQGRY